MFKPLVQNAVRLAASLVLLVVISVAAFVLFATLYKNIKQQQIKRDRQQFTEQLFEDPVAVRLRDEGRERCARTEFEHYWICGAVIQAAPLTPRGQCSTPERPLYYGSLDTESQEFALGDLKFFDAISVEDVSVSPTNDATPYGYPDVFPPEDLQQSEPVFSKNDGAPEWTWVMYEDVPVLFGKGSRDWSLTLQERSLLPARFTLKHPIFPFQIGKDIPLEQMDNWREIVDDAIEAVSGAVDSFDASRACSDPPASVRFPLEPYKIREIAAVRDWLLDFSTP